MNPYANYLGDRDPIAVLAATPARIRAEMERIGANAFTRTAKSASANAFGKP